MKKLIAVLILMFAFTATANAQDRKVQNAEEAAKIDAYKLSELIGLTGTQQDDFIRLFVMKHQTMNDPALSQDRKSEMSRIVEAKVRASLTPEQLKKLDANPALLASLRGDVPAAGPALKK